MSEFKNKLDKARFWDLDVSRKNDGRVSAVETTISESGSSQARRLTLRYTSKDNGTRLKLTHISDYDGGRLLVDDMVWATTFAEQLLADRIPDVEVVDTLEDRCGVAREDAASIDDLGER